MINTCAWALVGLCSDRGPAKRDPAGIRPAGSDKYPNQGGNTAEHEFITELLEERFGDADRERESLPTSVVIALRSQTGAVIDDFVLSEVKQGPTDCSGRRYPESGTAVVRNGHRKERTALTDIGPDSAWIARIRSRDGLQARHRGAETMAAHQRLLAARQRLCVLPAQGR